MEHLLHNVAELVDVDGKQLLQRFPESVRTHMTPLGQYVARMSAGNEVRFVATSDAPVRVTLSGVDPVAVFTQPARAWTYWGDFEAGAPVALGPEPHTFELTMPPHLKTMQRGGFAPQVCRLQFDGDGVYVHDISGDVRGPHPDELPPVRYLAYGTSITHGYGASRAALSYASRVAATIGADVRNLGCAGSAFCEIQMGEWIASLDWDVATLCLSGNMAGSGVPLDQFRETVAAFVAAVCATGRPVVCISLFTYAHDLGVHVFGNQAAPPDEFREALREIAAKHPNATYVNGRDLLDASGLMTDLVHPSDAGMLQIAERLAPIVRAQMPTG